MILRADRSVATLLRYQRNPHHKAGHGTHGQGDLRHGKAGEDTLLPVPLGTTIRDDGGVLIADLVEHGQQVTVMAGGRGGRGNAAFVNPSNRAPAVAEQGEYGKEAWFTLEMKLLADAALVGFPNAGKSTLISKVSAAEPKIADYPFTTLEPHLGVVSFDRREFVLADIPGLIEGAADGRGLGHTFLRHVERARVLVMLLDPTEMQEHPIDAQLAILTRELADYSAELAERPRVIVVNKVDAARPESHETEAGWHLISAVTGEGIRDMLHTVADLIEESERAAPERQGYALYRPLGPRFTVRRDEGMWVVEGLAAERAVAFADMTTEEAADMAAQRLSRLGIDEALADAGAREGDDVRIGEIIFEYTTSDEEE